MKTEVPVPDSNIYPELYDIFYAASSPEEFVMELDIRKIDFRSSDCVNSIGRLLRFLTYSEVVNEPSLMSGILNVIAGRQEMDSPTAAKYAAMMYGYVVWLMDSTCDDWIHASLPDKRKKTNVTDAMKILFSRFPEEVDNTVEYIRANHRHLK
jgi:hypothetical protein